MPRGGKRAGAGRPKTLSDYQYQEIAVIYREARYEVVNEMTNKEVSDYLGEEDTPLGTFLKGVLPGELYKEKNARQIASDIADGKRGFLDFCTCGNKQECLSCRIDMAAGALIAFREADYKIIRGSANNYKAETVRKTKQRFHEIYGIEISDRMIRTALSKLPDFYESELEKPDPS